MEGISGGRVTSFFSIVRGDEEIRDLGSGDVADCPSAQRSQEMEACVSCEHMRLVMEVSDPVDCLLGARF